MVAPEYSRAAELGKAMGLPVTFGAVNSELQRDLADRLGVTRFPTFLLYRAGDSGEPEAFPTLATAEAMVAGVARMLGVPGAEELSPAKEYSAEATTLDVASWLFWRGGDGGRLATTLVLFAPPLGACEGSSEGGTCSGAGADEQHAAAAAAAAGVEAAFAAAAGAAMTDPGLRFAIVRSEEVMREFEVPLDHASVVVYKDHDEGRAEYDTRLVAGAPSAAAAGEAMRAWLVAQNVPLVALVSHTTLQRYRANVRTLALLFVDESQTEHLPTLTRLLTELRSVAYALEAEGLVTRGDFTLGLTNGKKYASWLEHYGLPPAVLPALAAEATKTETLYAMPDAGAEWARAQQCGFAADVAVGPLGAWEVVKASLCGDAKPAAAAATVGTDGSLAGGAAAGGAPPSEWSDPKPYVPLAVSHIDLDAETIAGWLRAVLQGKVAPVKVPEPF